MTEKVSHSVSHAAPETCPTCRRYTESGRQQLSLRDRANPLTGIDLSRPLDVVFADIRREMVEVRSKLFDVRMGFTGWAEQVQQIEGLLTCGLIAMHHLQEQAKEHRELWARKDAEQLNTLQRPEGEPS
jgi:hypothetical protein